MNCFVYILANRTNSTIFTGVTSDLARRVWEHKNHVDSGSFTARYNIEKLVYYEWTSDITAAIQREKVIKGWTMERKNILISKFNPNWVDLYDRISQ
ncbi:MAG: GIY-YIG nuclease family protein [Acidaminococcaceae bacterium]|nr:GIY-YIG nuclease family protein [Acidaminococcaceae bacterium]